MSLSLLVVKKYKLKGFCDQKFSNIVKVVNKKHVQETEN